MQTSSWDSGKLEQQQQPLPLPAPDSAQAAPEAARQIDVNSVQKITLDDLGPMVVNSDGTLSRIANWQNMTDAERERTLRVLSARNRLVFLVRRFLKPILWKKGERIHAASTPPRVCTSRLSLSVSVMFLVQIKSTPSHVLRLANEEKKLREQGDAAGAVGSDGAADTTDAPTNSGLNSRLSILQSSGANGDEGAPKVKES
ncbi:hypothetical protein D9613_003744 [Agrocybe pediades]|uniref:Uncharacterized protein n=1 Tax=Agrocybe pediades TaxID=84607 RepID=A0A8H4QIC5_9AGAR|nr:hypothetical protein D9613_003744 [Agrocybe pediades]